MGGTRIQSEKDTVTTMIGMYCKGNHASSDRFPCTDCINLLEYAMDRLDCCPFGESKGACKNCEIHCYDDEYRESMARVMRYCGPRMLFRYPLMTLGHIRHSKWKQ